MDFVSTSISEAKKSLTLSVSPIPVKDFLDITINNLDFNNEIHLCLYNSNGPLIKSQIVNDAENIHLVVREIPSGIYFLKATSGNLQNMIEVIKS